MLRLPGKQNNSVRYFFDGYAYHRDARGAGMTFRCATRATTDCPGVVYVQSLINLDCQQLQVATPHNHESTPLLFLEEKFKQEVKERATERAAEDDPKDIYDFVLAKDEYVF